MKNDIIFGKQRDETFSNGWSCNRSNLTGNSAMRKWRTTFSNEGREIEFVLDKYNGSLHLTMNIKSGGSEEKSKEATLPLSDRTVSQFSKFALEQFRIAPSIFAATSPATQELQNFLKNTIREEIGFISANVAPRVQYENNEPERNSGCVIS